MTIALGMEQTGGYQGTDLDNSDESIDVQTQLNSHVSTVAGEHVHSLKK